MSQKPTGAERYFARRLEDAEYRTAHEEAATKIARVDFVMQTLEQRRNELRLSKAEIARRAGMKPDAVRRLFSAENPNPTLATLVAVAHALDLEIIPTPVPAINS